MRQLAAMSFALGLMFLVACDAINPVACTEDFRAVSIEVTGADLTQTHTIQKDNNDTLFSENNPLFADSYTVLDDNFQDELEGEERDFRFVGLVGDSVVVDEDFVIGADECHIYKVSGSSRVDL